MRFDNLHALWLTDADGLAPRAARSSIAPDAVIVDVAASPAPCAFGPLIERARALTRRSVLVWLSPPDAGRMDIELDAALPGRPDGVLLPECVDGRDVQQLGVKLAVREATCGWQAGSTAVIAAPGAAGLLALASFRLASPRLRGLALLDPAADLAPDDGLPDPASAAVRRAMLVLGARGAGVPAFDATSFALGEDVGAACRQTRRLGFCGRITRDAAAIPAIQDAFGPAPSTSRGISEDA